MATPHAFACRTRFDAIPGSATTFGIEYQCIVGDGVNPPYDFGGTYTYDATQTPAANLAAMKTAIAALCLSGGGFTVSTSNVLIDITLQ